MKRTIQNFLSLFLCFGFLLGLRGEWVALWREGEAHPEQIYDIRADTLPPADRLQLRRGIRMESREEVWAVLENYFD